jgi:broad specificity phosphatase PhoE
VIWLARHGETAPNAEGRVQGWLDPPLNDRGREQARELAEQAAGLDLNALYSSNLVRARETADIVAERVGLEPRVDDRFAESNRGAWEGRLLREIERDDPGDWAAWQRGGGEFRFPGGGESLAEHVARVDAALSDVQHGDLPALVVCHGGTIRCALVARAGRKLEDFTRIPVPNAALVPLEAG